MILSMTVPEDPNAERTLPWWSIGDTQKDLNGKSTHLEGCGAPFQRSHGNVSYLDVISM